MSSEANRFPMSSSVFLADREIVLEVGFLLAYSRAKSSVRLVLGCIEVATDAASGAGAVEGSSEQLPITPRAAAEYLAWRVSSSNRKRRC